MTMRKRPHFVGVWLAETGLTAVDTLATAERRSRSDMVRGLLAEALEARRKTKPRA